MGVISPSSQIKDTKALEALESGQSNVEEKNKPHLDGAAKLLSEWPELVLKVLCLMVLGAALGSMLAILLRLILPQLMTPEPEKVVMRTSIPAHLHMATTNLTARRACALEALASKHSDRPINLVLLREHPLSTVQMVYLLKQKYPNLVTHYHEDPDQFFESSPLDGLPKMGGSNDLLELAARTLSLWRHGGTSVDLDRPVMELPGEGVYVQRGGGSLLQFPQPCHPALQGLLTSLSEDVKSSAKEAIDRATKWICHLKSHDATDDEHFRPEKCLGVNVVEDKTDSNENLACPLIRSMHHTIVHNGVPIMDIAVDVMRKVVVPQSKENETSSSSETTEELKQTSAATPSHDTILTS